MKMKSGVGLAKVVLFATVLIYPMNFAFGAPAGGELSINVGEQDWIDKGLDIFYGNKKFGFEATIGGKTFGFGTGKYTYEERIYFVGATILGGTVLLITLVCCCCCLCYRSSRRNSPAVYVLPGNANYRYSTNMGRGMGANVPLYPTLPNIAS